MCDQSRSATVSCANEILESHWMPREKPLPTILSAQSQVTINQNFRAVNQFLGGHGLLHTEGNTQPTTGGLIDPANPIKARISADIRSTR